MATPAERASAELARAVRMHRRNPTDPACLAHLETAAEHLATVRTEHALSGVVGRYDLGAAARGRILQSVAARLGIAGTAA